MNAISAPKFKSSIPRPYVRKNEPNSASAPTKITLFRGTWCFGSIAPKNELGSALLLPMPYSSRAAPMCAPMPEPKLATTSVTPTMVNRGAQVRAAAHTYAVSGFGNASVAGHTSCATYTSAADRNPITTQVSTVASKILRRGFSASSESVEMPSNPIYDSTAIDVQPNRLPQVNVCGS